jgi:hypothetical protein
MFSKPDRADWIFYACVLAVCLVVAAMPGVFYE